MLGSVTAGVGVLGVVGWATCILGGSATSESSMKNPFTVTMAVLGTVALVLIMAAHTMAREPRMRVRHTQVHAP